MKQLILLALTFYSLTTLADERCPKISGTYLCGSENSAPFYIDVAQFHPKTKGDYFDVYILYYKYHNRDGRNADSIIPITLVTGDRYWTNAKLPENASRGLQVQATCEIGTGAFEASNDIFKAAGKPLLKILKAKQNRSFEETITVGTRKKGMTSEVVLITQQREGQLEGEPTLETCKPVGTRDPNHHFGKTPSGWRNVDVEIKLLGKNERFPDDKDSNVVAKIKGTHQAGKVKIDIQSEDKALRELLPGDTPDHEFLDFLKKYGFDI